MINLDSGGTAWVCSAASTWAPRASASSSSTRPGAVSVAERALCPVYPRRRADTSRTPASWWSALVISFRTRSRWPAAAISTRSHSDATSGTVLVESVLGTPRGPALMYDDARASAQAVRAQRVGGELWTALGYRMQPSWAFAQGALVAGPRCRRPRRSDRASVRPSAGPVDRPAQSPPTARTPSRPAPICGTISWPSDIFSELGIAPGVLPDLVTPGTVVGTVGRAAAAQLGITAGVVIRARNGLTGAPHRSPLPRCTTARGARPSARRWW